MATNVNLTEEDIRQLVYELIAVESAAREAELALEADTRGATDASLLGLIEKEIADRIAAINALQLSTNQSITRIDGNVTQLQTFVNQLSQQTTNSVSQLTSYVNTEIANLTALQNLILSVSNDMAIVKGDETVPGSIANALFDAKAYTDSKVTELLGGAPDLLNTLKELADAIGGDGNFVTTINNRITQLEETLSEQSGLLQGSIDDAKQEILDLVSQSLIKKEVITITQQHIDNGYVPLSGQNIIANSMVAFAGRLGIFENEDFALSVVSGSARLTFINDFAENGTEAVEVGEVLRLTYWSL